jgi:LysR family transcriptional regulator, hypochlorite-specific transcription factor HypT
MQTLHHAVCFLRFWLLAMQTSHWSCVETVNSIGKNVIGATREGVLEIRWLHDFLTLAETGNFTRAASLRHTSQAAFSRRIQQLEAYLGAPLVDRGIFPTRLTPEGETFRRAAGEMLRQVADARAEIAGRAESNIDHIRLALPFALATSQFPTWWADWSFDRALSSELKLGNVHDLGNALISGTTDIMICFESTLQPIELGDERVESLLLAHETMRPYASSKLIGGQHFTWPSKEARPVPFLMYSPGVYFARLVDLTLKDLQQPLVSRRMLTSDMADVLREFACLGQGVAWLPDKTAAASGEELTALPGDNFAIPLSIKAFRLRDNSNRATWRLWDIMKRNGAEIGT